MKSTATTVHEYLDSLADDRREALKIVRDCITAHLPEGYEEAINWGMISYQVPLSVYPDTYNKQPLMYAALGSQKNHMAVYLMCAYGDPKVKQKMLDDFAAAGKKLDMGGSCLRFKKLDDLPLAAIANCIAAVPMGEFIARAKAVKRK